MAKNTPKDTHDWLLEKWKTPTTFVGNYINDGIYVMSGKIDSHNVITEAWSVPAGIMLIKHQIDPEGAHCQTIGQFFIPHDPMS